MSQSGQPSLNNKLHPVTVLKGVGTRIAEKLEKLGHMGHFRLYTLKEIESLIRYIGLRIINIEYKGKYKRPRDLAARLLQLLHPRKRRFLSTIYVTSQKD